MITIASMFERYRREVMSPNSRELQVIETRRAFYAASFAVLVALRDDVSVLPEPLGVLALEALHAECREFGKAVERGEA
jgi:hypothetical protein